VKWRKGMENGAGSMIRAGGGSLIITNWPDDLLKACLSFVGPGNYLYVAETCHKLNEQYTFRKETTWKNAAISVSCAQLCLQDFRTHLRKTRRKCYSCSNKQQCTMVIPECFNGWWITIHVYLEKINLLWLAREAMSMCLSGGSK
jgi:hypothetical protein